MGRLCDFSRIQKGIDYIHCRVIVLTPAYNREQLPNHLTPFSCLLIGGFGYGRPARLRAEAVETTVSGIARMGKFHLWCEPF